MAWLPNRMAWGAWPLMGLYGVYMALTDGVGKALIADHAPQESRGLAMGIFYATTGLTTLLASLLAGWIWDRWGSQLRSAWAQLQPWSPSLHWVFRNCPAAEVDEPQAASAIEFASLTFMYRSP